MLGRAVHPSAETFNYLEPFLASADLVLANLESPLTNSPIETESPHALCAPPENVKYLADAGFDLLTLANNHSLDCGPEGLDETQSTLTDAGLGFIGPEPEPVYRVINGIRLAFLAFDATSGFDIETAAQAVRSAREAGAMVILSIHWGAEYQAGASAGQEQIAGILAEAGAALSGDTIRTSFNRQNGSVMARRSYSTAWAMRSSTSMVSRTRAGRHSFS
jgi:poly-gamma-glutamate synthesis protein (capsule biosynthesis protein)